jgi:FKBP-type peptidyl-prolyl cis-trans isomerase FklB
MKSLSTCILALGFCAMGFAADSKPAAAPTAAPAAAAPAAVPDANAQFKDSRDKVSYSLGVNIGNTLKMQGADINVDELAKGVRDFLAGNPKLDEKQVRENLMAWQQEMRTKRMEKMRVEGEKNKKASDEWLAENAKKPGVKTLPDGLQYKVLVPGKGPQAKAGDRVSAHYRGTLTDGTQFDSSYESGRPLVTSTLGGVIPGWLEALTNMHVGDKWELYIPSQLAYGEQGRPPKIPPSSALIFELELLSIEPPQTNAAAAPGFAPGGPGFPPGGPGAGQPQIRVQQAPGANQPIRVQPAK